jgi:hypothetical protein
MKASRRSRGVSPNGAIESSAQRRVPVVGVPKDPGARKYSQYLSQTRNGGVLLPPHFRARAAVRVRSSWVAERLLGYACLWTLTPTLPLKGGFPFLCVPETGFFNGTVEIKRS